MPQQRPRLTAGLRLILPRRLGRAGSGGILFLCLLFTLVPAARATSSALRPTIVSLAVLTDPQENKDVTWAQAQYRADRFRELAAKVYSAPGLEAFWLRLVVSVPPGVDSAAFSLELNWPFLRLLKWRIPGCAALLPATPGDWNIYLPAPLPLPANLHGDVAVYARLAGYGSVNLNPTIATGRDVALQATLRPWILGLFFGLMGSMLVYNLFLFLSLRDASYGYYVTNVAVLIFYYACTTGLAAEFIPNPSREQHALFLSCFEISSALLFANMGLFTRSFLLTRKASPVIDRIVFGQIVLSFLAAAAFAVSSHKASVYIGPPMGLVTSTVISLAAVVRLVQGFKPAAIFTVGWGIFVACGAVHSLTWLGIVAATPASIHAILAGTAAEVLIMSLALAYRVKLLREQTQLAEQERRRLSLEKARSDEAREDLTRENTLLAMILDDHRFGIGVARDGRFQFANRQLARHLGCEELTGQALADVPHAMRFLGNALPQPGDQDSEQEAVIGEDGGGRALRAVGRRLDPARPEQGIVYIVEDVSEARRLEKLKNDIDQVMRHELKGPLATIAGIQEALELAGPLTDRQRSLTAMLERTTAAMTSRLNLSLYLYKMETGSLRLTPQPLSLARALEEARLELAPFLTADASLEIAYETRPEAFTVLGEQTLLVFLLVSLLRNALEAAKGLGPVVATVSDPDAPRLVIVNPGETPAGIRDRFFEKYVTAGKPGGDGLGTYSARLIARTFGGDVTLDASRPGWTTIAVTGLRPG